MIIVNFFRDTLSGIWYWLYLLLCIFSFFYVLGIVADSKREKINKKLKEKKSYDIESGKEAAIAAMESKQVLAVNEEEQASTPQTTDEVATTTPEVKKEEEPLVISSSEPTITIQEQEPTVNAVVPPVAQATIQPAPPVPNQPVTPPTQPVSPAAVTPMEQARNEEPLVINSN